MRALERGNDAAAALRHAAVHAAHVRAELETEPGPELEREVARLRANGGNGTAVADPASAERSNGASVAPASAPAEAKPSDGKARRSPLRVAVAAAGVVAIVSIAVFETTKFRRAQAAAAPDSSHVLVAALTNRTGDSTLDYIGYIAADWITQSLSQSEIVKVVYGPTAFELSRTAPGGASASDSDRVRVLSMRSGAGTLIHGSYYLVHDSIVISAEVTDGRSGRVLRRIPPITTPKSDPMRGVQLLRERSVGALATVLEPRLGHTWTAWSSSNGGKPQGSRCRASSSPRSRIPASCCRSCGRCEWPGTPGNGACGIRCSRCWRRTGINSP
jgi:TolB-like protein